MIFFTAGSVLSLSFGPYVWARQFLRSGLFARWLGWAGVLTGVTGLVWFVWFLELPLLAVLVVNVVASLVFYTGVSIALIRGAGEQAKAEHVGGRHSGPG